jgi:Reverse transcriptase (RNA-dependent DNA polymerase)
VVKLKKALYGCVESAKLWYDKISNDLIKLKYTINEYDNCVFNRIELNGSQTTLVIHVDDMIISSYDDKYIDRVINEIEQLYPGLTKTRGKVFSYIGMSFNFETPGKVTITIDGFVNDLLKECQDIVGVSPAPGKPTLFHVGDMDDTNHTNPLLSDSARERFHSLVAKLLYLSKRVRPDLLTLVAFLTKRVQSPRRDDQEKLKQGIRYLRGTKDLGLTLEVDYPVEIIAYIDASYGVHPDKKSHTGAMITLGKGCIYGKSGTQRLNTKSSTEAEIVAVSDAANQVLWTRNFMLAQGYRTGPAKIYQDNMSNILRMDDRTVSVHATLISDISSSLTEYRLETLLSPTCKHKTWLQIF